MDFNAVMQALPIAAAGMLGVFAVIAVIMLFIIILNKLIGNKK